MRIEPWDVHAASEDELRSRYELETAISIDEDPETPPRPYELWHKQIVQASPFVDVRRWHAYEGDELVGYGFLGLNRTEDNPHLCEGDINVSMSYRRRGIARALLRPILDDARADGRTTLGMGARQGSPGEGFLAASGLEQKLLDRRSRLHVKDLDPSLVGRWIDDATTKANGYSLVLFDGRVPDEHIQAVIDVQQTMNDAPRDGLDMDDWNETVEEFRDGESRALERGTNWLLLVVRHDATGEFAGFTQLAWHPLVPQLVWQYGTAVRREHRGHALGRWMKAANLRSLLEANPAAEFVDTWNAGSNKWMLAINDDLGFRPYIWYQAYQGRIDDIRKAIA